MSENGLAVLLTCAIVVGLVAWEFALRKVCPPCISFLQHRREQRRASVANDQVASSPDNSARVA